MITMSDIKDRLENHIEKVFEDTGDMNCANYARRTGAYSLLPLLVTAYEALEYCKCKSEMPACNRDVFLSTSNAIKKIDEELGPSND